MRFKAVIDAVCRRYGFRIVRTEGEGPRWGRELLLKSTLDQLDSIVALYRELGLDGGISFQGLQEMPSYSDYYSEQLTGEILSQNEKRTLGQYLVRFLSDTTINRSGSNVGFYARLFAELPTRPNTCPWLSNAG